MNDISKTIEAILFFKGEPVSISSLAKILSIEISAVEAGLATLEKRLTHGIVLMRNDSEVVLRTAPSESEQIIALQKEELSRDIGKAGLETISIILYRGPVTRAEIDYIRGVNSTFILRNLLVRGLIEKKANPKDARSFLYQPTVELLSFLGVKDIAELPEYEAVRGEIAVFEKQYQEKESNDGSKQ